MGKLVLFCLFYISPVYKLHLLLPLQSLYRVVGLITRRHGIIKSVLSTPFFDDDGGGNASEDDAEP